MSDPIENYAWDSDEGWLILLKKLEFPPNMDETKKEKHLLKKKRKYYKKKVDPNYEIPKVEEKPKVENDKTNNNTSYSENTNKQSNDNSNNEPLKNPFEEEKPETKPKAQPEPKAKPKPKQQARASQSRPSSRNSVPILSKLLNYYYVLSQLFVLIGSFLTIINPIFFRYVLLVAGASYLVAVLQNHGRPQFNQYYMERVMKDENFMVVFYAFMFLLAQPSIVFLIPLTLRSLFMSSFMLNSLLNNSIPKLTELFNKVISNQLWFTNQVAIIEVYMGIYLIICIFWMRNSIILAIMYWQINGLKYTVNANTKTAFWRVNQTFENYLSKIPMLLNIYRKMTGYMYSMVDPERIRQQAQQAQAGGGRRCTIM